MLEPPTMIVIIDDQPKQVEVDHYEQCSKGPFPVLKPIPRVPPGWVIAEEINGKVHLVKITEN